MEIKSLATTGRETRRGTAMDHPEALNSSSPSSSSFHPAGRHFYVAVDRLLFKLDTLVDLLGVTGRRPFLPVVLCCNSRDELDAVYAAVSNLNFISSFPLYSDQAEAERASTLEKFRQSTIGWNQNANVHSGDGVEPENQKSCMIIVTDACLPFVTLGEAPLAARVLINYELPSKKETYLRRMSTCLAADGIVINMVVGGEVVILKGLEESSGLILAEMPINISEIL
ncbi:eukaryotic initiation factor 4A-III-A isoform X2 [Phalaenopsis equestris]|uniref:eukaryotic initiation factor 4A-III-A isoform X2 n=1 Tax=Phalaenopsis equestris TaxID=78828 RepID=UPI0009E44B4F|nr:eukaryotic initiation factor 4A-III-A isoform X2 [Phalaenopsis equestris]